METQNKLSNIANTNLAPLGLRTYQIGRIDPYEGDYIFFETVNTLTRHCQNSKSIRVCLPIEDVPENLIKGRFIQMTLSGTADIVTPEGEKAYRAKLLKRNSREWIKPFYGYSFPFQDEKEDPIKVDHKTYEVRGIMRLPGYDTFLSVIDINDKDSKEITISIPPKMEPKNMDTGCHIKMLLADKADVKIPNFTGAAFRINSIEINDWEAASPDYGVIPDPDKSAEIFYPSFGKRALQL